MKAAIFDFGGVLLQRASEHMHRKEESLFIDDWPPNVEGARVFGMHGIVFRDTEQAIREVKGYL